VLGTVAAFDGDGELGEPGMRGPVVDEGEAQLATVATVATRTVDARVTCRVSAMGSCDVRGGARI
jgi:hypothetical protein